MDKEILKKPSFWFILVLLISFAVRIYYLILSNGQAMWWDEAEYMSTAKHWAFGIPYNLNEQRPPIFQLLAALFLKLGFVEYSLKFLLVILPSVFLVALTYYLGKEMFGTKIALVASLLTSFVWTLLFWSVRFQPDFFSVTLQLCAFLFFWKYVKTDKQNFAILSGLFCAISFYFKISALLVPLCIGIFLLYKDGWKAAKLKNNWIILGTFIVALIPFMLWQTLSFGNPLAFGTTYSGDFNVGRAPGWMALSFYYEFAKPFMFVLFLMGLGITLFITVITFDILLKDKSLRKDPSLFSFIVLLVIALFYIFYIRGTIEDRWLFLIIPFISFFAAKPLVLGYDKLRKDSKFLAILFLVVCLSIIIIPQLNYSTALINDKKDTYYTIKEASLLIKENSLPSDKVLSVSYTQTTAYAEREVITYSEMPLENFTRVLNEFHPRFLLVSIWEPHHPSWILQQAQNQEGFKGTLFPYFNSSIIFSPENQLVQYDVKTKVSNEVADFTLIYPIDQYGGVLVYKIDYRS